MASTTIDKLKPVGRYALGVEWADRHESIIPYKGIRRACACDTCTVPEPPVVALQGEHPVRLEQLGGQSLFVVWADGHETILLTEELRAMCRCAHCAGEPEYPISGR
ncbi:MAG TPA: gamma-butyrobetaine hydroxylase-like domain-containing protein [Candidatus Binatia bacterium]|nr:gamma-butyrobetaine hydroxylase-like domain-containing protein [Candidatus Binatia bacterium]